MKASGIADEALAEQRELSSRKHFEVLDGLRGIAALSVVLYHSFNATHNPVPNAPLAVDMFFLLSGFVIAYSYEGRLRGRMPVREFFVRRLIRLYPMLFIGAAGGLAIALVHNVTHPADAYPLRSIAASGALSLLVLPYLSSRPMDIRLPATATVNEGIFNFNPPIWSLFFELIANAFYAVTAKYLSKTILAALVAAGLAGIVIGGAVGGGAKTDFWWGFPRVAFGFFGGVLVHRLWRENKLPDINGNFLLLSVIAIAVFAFPFPIRGLGLIPAYAILAAVIICGVGSRSSRLDKYCALLGQISYPVYLIHWLTLYFVTWGGKFFGFTGARYVIVVGIHLLLVPVIAFLVLRYYEVPVRLYLTNIYNRAPKARAAINI